MSSAVFWYFMIALRLRNIRNIVTTTRIDTPIHLNVYVRWKIAHARGLDAKSSEKKKQQAEAHKTLLRDIVEYTAPEEE